MDTSAPPNTVALRPTAGSTLMLPDGGTTLDGLALAPGAELPAEGAYVPAGVWATRRQEHGDAEPVPGKAVKKGERVVAAREQPAPGGTPA